MGGGRQVLGGRRREAGTLWVLVTACACRPDQHSSACLHCPALRRTAPLPRLLQYVFSFSYGADGGVHMEAGPPARHRSSRRDGDPSACHSSKAFSTKDQSRRKVGARRMLGIAGADLCIRDG